MPLPADGTSSPGAVQAAPPGARAPAAPRARGRQRLWRGAVGLGRANSGPGRATSGPGRAASAAPAELVASMLGFDAAQQVALTCCGPLGRHISCPIWAASPAIPTRRPAGQPVNFAERNLGIHLSRYTFAAWATLDTRRDIPSLYRPAMHLLAGEGDDDLDVT